MIFDSIETRLNKLNNDEKLQVIMDVTSDMDKKALLLRMLKDIVDGSTSSIGKQLGEELLKQVIKSTGNNITAFVVRDKD